MEDGGDMKACENCAREIGRLEQPQVFNGYTVCPNCYRLLSDAITRPIQHTTPSARTPQVQTIEQTGKEWKAIQVIGGFGVVVGVICVMAEAAEIGLALAVAGFLMFICGRLGAWWCHG
jgi:hypothetical protein